MTTEDWQLPPENIVREIAQNQRDTALEIIQHNLLVPFEHALAPESWQRKLIRNVGSTLEALQYQPSEDNPQAVSVLVEVLHDAYLPVVIFAARNDDASREAIVVIRGQEFLPKSFFDGNEPQSTRFHFDPEQPIMGRVDVYMLDRTTQRVNATTAIYNPEIDPIDPRSTFIKTGEVTSDSTPSIPALAFDNVVTAWERGNVDILALIPDPTNQIPNQIQIKPAQANVLEPQLNLLNTHANPDESRTQIATKGYIFSRENPPKLEISR